MIECEIDKVSFLWLCDFNNQGWVTVTNMSSQIISVVDYCDRIGSKFLMSVTKHCKRKFQ